MGCAKAQNQRTVEEEWTMCGYWLLSLSFRTVVFRNLREPEETFVSILKPEV